MGDTTLPDYPRGVTFEQFWAGLQELREYQKESYMQLKESQLETEKKLKESSARLDKKLSKLGIRLGDIVEDMIEPNLMKKISKTGVKTFELSRNRVLHYEGEKYIEADILIEDGEKVLVVEVKSKASVNDVKNHVKRMMKMRIYADSKADKRKYYGAVGSLAFEEKAREHIFGCGFYLIEPSGNAFTITAPKGIYSLREW